jgi:hypothetical protein
MPNFDAVAREHVLRALEEYDELGADELLTLYGFGRARQYLLWHDGKSYDSKAILAVSYSYAAGTAATSSEFSGGKDGAARILRELGFSVTLLTTQNKQKAPALARGERPPKSGPRPRVQPGPKRLEPSSSRLPAATAPWSRTVNSQLR